MTISEGAATMEYVLDVLEQLSQLARRDGLDRLAEGIETVVGAERSDAGILPAQRITIAPKPGQP